MEERLFNLDIQLIADSFLTIVALFVLFLFMSYFLFNPARKLLQNRQEKIKGELDDAKANMESAKALKEEYEGKLKNIEAESAQILSESRKKALENESQIIARAREEAGRIMDRAKVEAQLEREKMVDDVKREMVVLASLMAGKVVSASMDMKVQNSLIDETLKELGEATWLS